MTGHPVRRLAMPPTTRTTAGSPGRPPGTSWLTPLRYDSFAGAALTRRDCDRPAGSRSGRREEIMTEGERREFEAALSGEVDAWLKGDASRRTFLTRLLVMGGAAMLPGLGWTATGSRAWAA